MPKKIHEIEYLRAVAILAVVGVHVTGNFGKISHPGLLMDANRFLQVFLRLAVPLFLLISGAVLSLRYRSGFSVADFYRKRLNVLLLPYAAYSVLYMVIYGALKGRPSPADIARKLLTGTASEHLWFFVLIFQLYLLYPVLIALALKSRRLFFFGALAAQVAVNALLPIESVPDLLNQPLTCVRFGFYFAAGIVIGLDYDRFRNAVRGAHAWAAGAGALALTFLNFQKPELACFTEPFLFCGSSLVFFRLVEGVDAAGRTGRFLHALARHSFGIYLIHILFMGIAVRVMKPWLVQDDWLFYPVLFAASLGPSWVSMRVWSRLRPQKSV
jgi:surface polysaccharide O-acyltransferase-like enzyme